MALRKEDLPIGFSNWLQFLDHILNKFPESNNESIIQIQIMDKNSRSEITFKSLLKEIKLAAFEEIQENLRLDMKTYIEIIRMPCSQNGEIRDYFTKLQMLAQESNRE